MKRRETKGIGVGKIAEGYERSEGGKNEMKKKEDAGDEDMREREREGKKPEDRSMDVKEG